MAFALVGRGRVEEECAAPGPFAFKLATGTYALALRAFACLGSCE